MPNIKSAKKRVLITKKNNVSNNDVKSTMRTAIKKLEKAIANKEKDVKALFDDAYAKIDKCLKANIIKDNTAARYKSRLSKMVNNNK
jgi:small subunit ribosomal protein S20